MAKSILTIPLDEFQKVIYKIESKNLVSLLEGLVKFKWEYGKYWDDQTVSSIELKHSRILKELQRRGYLGKKERGQFNEWMSKINTRKRQW